ncbi:MAG: DUF1080 domain-containing protein [Verrucomicrobia bacterium]|nr:DUF1080 domain-containing protein [Verrucomicrobiota bacterium]
MFTSLCTKTRQRPSAFKWLVVTAACLALAGCVNPESDKHATPAPSTAAPEAVHAQATPTPSPSAAPASAVSEPQAWQSLFDGKTLAGWRETQFAGHGGAHVENGNLVVDAGGGLSGVNYTNTFPKINYEFVLEAKRVEGSDFFCGITFPVGDTFASFIVGGWGCCIVGVSSVNGEDASQNETSSTMAFEKGRWYRIRLRVMAAKIEAWIDDKQVVDLETTDKRISLRYGEIELSKPFGLATWVTTAAWRDIRLRQLEPKAGTVGK